MWIADKTRPSVEDVDEPRLTVSGAARRLGIAPATLRTWDRRYGIGPTGHARGRHRRYSADDMARLELMQRALMHLPQPQREALILVGAGGFAYEEAAEICGCAVGTIKSRVNRARSRLASLLAVDDVEDLGPDRMTRAALQAIG